MDKKSPVAHFTINPPLQTFAVFKQPHLQNTFPRVKNLQQDNILILIKNQLHHRIPLRTNLERKATVFIDITSLSRRVRDHAAVYLRSSGIVRWGHGLNWGHKMAPAQNHRGNQKKLWHKPVEIPLRKNVETHSHCQIVSVKAFRNGGEIQRLRNRPHRHEHQQGAQFPKQTLAYIRGEEPFLLWCISTPLKPITPQRRVSILFLSSPCLNLTEQTPHQ